MSTSSPQHESETTSTGNGSFWTPGSALETDLYPTIRRLWSKGEITLFEAYRMEKYYLLEEEEALFPGEKALTRFLDRVLEPKYLVAKIDLSKRYVTDVVQSVYAGKMGVDEAMHLLGWTMMAKDCSPQEQLDKRWEAAVDYHHHLPIAENNNQKITQMVDLGWMTPEAAIDFKLALQREALAFPTSSPSTAGTTSTSTPTSPAPSSSSTSRGWLGLATGRGSSFVSLREMPGFY